jgi:dethiobiotin synthetase
MQVLSQSESRFPTTAARHGRGEWAGISPVRLEGVKFSFVTRRVERPLLASLVTGAKPTAGDLVLARVTKLGQHNNVHLPDGRRSTLFVGDEVVLAYGARYAPDQYEGRVPSSLSACDLLAGGGIAGEALRWPSSVRKPTRLEPIGLLGDEEGRPLNLRRFALPTANGDDRRSAPVVAVVGSSMNSGKTTAAASLIRGATRAGFRVGAAKATGTGAGGDYWMYADAGAKHVLDFTDCGYGSTYLIGTTAVESVFAQLVAHLQSQAPDLVVLEIADGLLQQETAGLLRSAVFRSLVDGVVYCGADALGAAGGVEWLEQRGIPVLGVSGKLTASPLAAREAAAATKLPVWTREDLANSERAVEIRAASSRTLARTGTAR